MDWDTLHSRHPDIRPRSWVEAAVALVFRQGDGDLELLLIERATRPGRRWSGDMAFPGGIREPGDQDSIATARRECNEEVGLDLGTPRGRLREVFTVRPRGFKPMAITPWLFALPPGQEAGIASEEVADLVWLPVEALRDRTHRARLWKRFGRVPVPFPMVELSGRRIWGLTLQMIDRL